MCVVPALEVSDSASDLTRQVKTVNRYASPLNDDSADEDLFKYDGVRSRPSRSAIGSSALSWHDVAQHASHDDAWIIVKNKVYDVTSFGKKHPGGNVIYKFAGRDATDAFATFHSAQAWSMMRQFKVGELSEERSDSDSMIADFRALKLELQRAGLFKASHAYYTLKLLSILAVVGFGYGLMVAFPDSLASFLLSAALVALGLQQFGWLSHDYNHNQVFANRRWNLVGSYLTGCVAQGFCVHWWKNKHNTHHAVPNQLDDEGAAQDPDIDTLPYLAWSLQQVEAARLKGGSWLLLVRFQQYLLWPLLAAARLMWAEQSLETALMLCKESWKGVLEVFLIGVHYAWLLVVPCMKLGGWGPVAAWFMVTQVFGGLFLSYVFIQSHNGMEVYSQDKDFATAQIVSTRNVTPTWFNNWFTGGLNYQIEHHLFPALPRHNFHKVAGRVRALCEKHGLVYESVGMFEAVRRVMAHLASIAKAV